MADWASRDAVQNASQRWTEEQIICRVYSHSWRPRNVTHSPGSYTTTQRCSRCRNERYQIIDEQGYILTPWRTDYREGYLMPPGFGRVGTDGRAVLRLASLQNMAIREVPDDT